jgi:2-methylisocitrate lyase-like PEP mutase family enzyme
MTDNGTAFACAARGAGRIHHPQPPGISAPREILAAIGLRALATTSAGMAFSLGLSDHEPLPHHRRGHAACRFQPISKRGFGDSPESVAATVRAAAGIGFAGRSIEGRTDRRDDRIVDFGLAVKRVAAAAQACRILPDDVVLTARCERFLRGRPDLDDTIRRQQAFQSAGANVL